MRTILVADDANKEVKSLKQQRYNEQKNSVRPITEKEARDLTTRPGRFDRYTRIYQVVK